MSDKVTITEEQRAEYLRLSAMLAQANDTATLKQAADSNPEAYGSAVASSGAATGAYKARTAASRRKESAAQKLDKATRMAMTGDLVDEDGRVSNTVVRITSAISEVAKAEAALAEWKDKGLKGKSLTPYRNDLLGARARVYDLAKEAAGMYALICSHFAEPKFANADVALLHIKRDYGSDFERLFAMVDGPEAAGEEELSLGAMQDEAKYALWYRANRKRQAWALLAAEFRPPKDSRPRAKRAKTNPYTCEVRWLRRMSNGQARVSRDKAETGPKSVFTEGSRYGWIDRYTDLSAMHGSEVHAAYMGAVNNGQSLDPFNMKEEWLSGIVDPNPAGKDGNGGVRILEVVRTSQLPQQSQYHDEDGIEGSGLDRWHEDMRKLQQEAAARYSERLAGNTE